MTDDIVVSLLSNLDRSHTQCNTSSIYFEQTFACGVDVPLIFKMLREIKRFILNLNEKKYPRQIQHPIKDLKTEVLVKIVVNFKLQTSFVKRSILDVSQVLSSPLTTINQTFFTNNKRAMGSFKRYVTLFLAKICPSLPPCNDP